MLVDYFEAPPAASYADVHCRVSTFDVPACVEAAKKHGVDGVMTLGTDQPVLTAALVSEAMGLPTPITERTALAVTNKRVMKWLLDCAGLPSAPHRFLHVGDGPEALGGLHPPYVLKPVDSQGQRGVFLLEDGPSVLKRLPDTLSFSREDAALVEEYFFAEQNADNPYGEVTFSGWVQDSRLYPLTLTDRMLHPDPVHIGVCTGHRFPSVHMDRYEEVLELCGQLPEAFGIENGPLYVQLLIGERGIVINELACRIGGAFEDVFIPYITGFDILEAVMGEALGQRADVSMLEGYDPSDSPRQAFVRLLFGAPGKISRMTPAEELNALPFVLDAGWNYHPGEEIPPIKNATARLGHLVLVADGDMKRKLARADAMLSVTDPDGRELLIPGPAF